MVTEIKSLNKNPGYAEPEDLTPSPEPNTPRCPSSGHRSADIEAQDPQASKS